ncbi:MAG: MFS transporter [Thermodesulfobacteriota bacterium]
MPSPSTDINQDGPPNPGSLWNGSLLFIYLATFLSYANFSVFFRFYEHLQSLPISPRWYGLIIGLYSATSLIVRPLVSPLIHPGNQRRLLYAGTAAVMASLAAYSLADGLGTMLAVRIFHGLAFVIQGAALMALTVTRIPPEKSGQAFGLLSIIILIPNTVIPPALPFLEKSLGGFNHVLLGFSALTVLIYPLLMGRSNPDDLRKEAGESRRLTAREIWDDLRDTRIVAVLAAMLCLYFGHAAVFFFLDEFGRTINIAEAGFFLTLSTAGEIGVRLAAGSFFDKMNKSKLAAWALAGLALGYLALSQAGGRWSFFGLGLVLGLGWGVAMPVFNGLMYDLSATRYKAFNINLGLQMFQGGFFLGPILGGLMAAHLGLLALFGLCGLISLLAAGLTFTLKTKAPD